MRSELLKDVNTVYAHGKPGSPQRRGPVEQELLREPAERELYRRFQEVEPEVRRALQERRYGACLELLASLKEPVDRFFDQVLVMAEDEKLRRNRLNLLAAVKGLFNRFADFALLQPVD